MTLRISMTHGIGRQIKQPSKTANRITLHWWSILLYAILISGTVSCASMKSKYGKDLLRKSLISSPLLNDHFTGFALFDPDTETYLYQQHADKYFTPASNTKLFTFYTGLKLLRDSVPGLKYQIAGDSLIFTGTGDPTFLHYAFEDQPIFDLLKDTTYQLYMVKPKFEDTKFGDGWAWEDYEYYFQPERSAFPIYGNTVHFAYDSVTDAFSVLPQFFQSYTDIRSIESEKTSPYRLKNTNIFNFAPDTARSEYKNCVPFKTSDALTIALLEDTLGRKVHWIEDYTFEQSKIKYSRPANELFAYMLKVSDNLSAEQILYLCAAEMYMDLDADLIRHYMLSNAMKDLSPAPIWKDGSGLSRYNLMTPITMVEIVRHIIDEIGTESFKTMLPAGGRDGTLHHWYQPLEGESPYVFAKTGTLSNNHSLTGIIHTKSGRELYFSFMNNNYPSGSSPIKVEMEKVMRVIYERY